VTLPIVTLAWQVFQKVKSDTDENETTSKRETKQNVPNFFFFFLFACFSFLYLAFPFGFRMKCVDFAFALL